MPHIFYTNVSCTARKIGGCTRCICCSLSPYILDMVLLLRDYLFGCLPLPLSNGQMEPDPFFCFLQTQIRPDRLNALTRVRVHCQMSNHAIVLTLLLISYNPTIFYFISFLILEIKNEMNNIMNNIICISIHANLIHFFFKSHLYFVKNMRKKLNNYFISHASLTPYLLTHLSYFIAHE